MAAASSLALRPFAAVGATIRSALVFARGSGWSFLVSRSKIDFRSEIGDPSTNSIVGAVVGWISRNFPDAPVRIVREDDPESAPILRSATGPGAMLRLLERPNAFFSGVLQWMATIVDYVTDGNAYWIKVRNASGRVIALWWVPQRMLDPRWFLDDPSSFIGWYEYRVDGVLYAIDPRDVVHFRNGLDPDNPRKGRAPLRALFREIFTDEEGANFTASLLRNLGVPGVVIAPSNTTGGRPLETDPEAVKTSFMEKFGGDKRGEPLILTAPTDVKVLSFNPLEMDLKALRRIPEERISAVLGVPAGVAGLGAGLDRNTFTNYGEANKAAYTQAVIPLQRLIAAELEIQLLPEFAGSEADLLDVYFDAAATHAMAEAAGEVWKRAESAAAKGLIKRSTFKRLTGQKVEPGDEVYLRPNNYVEVDAASGEISGGPVSGGGNAPAALPSGEAPAGLLAAGPDAGEVRCARCEKLLAEQAAPPYRFTCPRCHQVTAVDAEARELEAATA